MFVLLVLCLCQWKRLWTNQDFCLRVFFLVQIQKVSDIYCLIFVLFIMNYSFLFCFVIEAQSVFEWDLQRLLFSKPCKVFVLVLNNPYFTLLPWTTHPYSN